MFRSIFLPLLLILIRVRILLRGISVFLVICCRSIAIDGSGLSGEPATLRRVAPTDTGPESFLALGRPPAPISVHTGRNSHYT